MSDIKAKAQGIEPNLQPRDVVALVGNHESVYEALNIISKRARQISADLKHEITRKLEEFAETSEVIEEVQENKEQIEISKFYERLPNPALIAANEFMHDEIINRYVCTSLCGTCLTVCRYSKTPIDAYNQY
jgi:Na+-translocating ferredoxin:NAD+ oxidoreductase RNF subunit RnfB